MRDPKDPTKLKKGGSAPGVFGGGQVPHEKTPELAFQVKELAGFQMTQENIAKVLGISADTLQKHYRDEIDEGRTAMELRLRRSLFEQAMGVKKDPDDPNSEWLTRPNMVAGFFLAKTQFGFRETSRHEHFGGGAVQINITEDDAQL